jgi:hypothetical protein
MKYLKAALRGTGRFCLDVGRTVAKSLVVIALLTGIGIGSVLGPQLLTKQFPNLVIPNAWAEFSSGAIKAVSSITSQPENISSASGALYAFGQVFPGEIVGIGRQAFISYDTCVVYTVDTGIKTGLGMVSRIAFLSGTAAAAILYDNTAASGTKIFDNSAIGITPTTGVPGPSYTIGGAFGTGLYLDISGTNPVVEVCSL